MTAIALVVFQLSSLTSPSSPPNSPSSVVKCSRKDQRVQAASVYKNSPVAACPFPFDLGKVLATVSSINNTPSSLIRVALSLSPTSANRGRPGITTATFTIHSTPSTAFAHSTTPRTSSNMCTTTSPSTTPAINSSIKFHICGMHEINFQKDFPFLQLDEGSPTGTIMVILLHNSCVASTLASESGTPRNTVFECEFSMHSFLDPRQPWLQIYKGWPNIGTPASMPNRTSRQFSISIHSFMNPFQSCVFASFAHILTSCNMQDFIKFKLRIFSCPRKGYDPGFIHIILSFVSMIELEATTKALALLHDMESDAYMFHCLKTWTITRG